MSLAWRNRLGLPLRIALLMAGSGVLAVVANAVSPAGIPWGARFESDMRSRATQAGLEPIALSEMPDLLRRPRVLLLDARAAKYYDQGHLPGARSLPWPERDLSYPPLADAVQKAERIVVYCGSAYCDAGLELGKWLRARGLARVGLFVEGFDLWEVGGGSVESGRP